MNQWVGVLYQFDRNNLSIVLTHWHIGRVKSAKQCITVDLFPHILAKVVDNEKEHLLLPTPVLKQTPRLSSKSL